MQPVRHDTVRAWLAVGYAWCAAMGAVGCTDEDVLAPPGSAGSVPDGGGGAGGTGAGGTGSGGSGAGGSGGTSYIPTDSKYPKINMLIWGGASPAWYAEFDWVILSGYSGGLEAKDLNPDLLVSQTRDWNACFYEGNVCPHAWRVETEDGEDIDAYGNQNYLGDTSDECGLHDGMTYRQYIVEWSLSLDWDALDGWNSDGVWENIGWKAAYDLDEDGDSDSTDEQLWIDGRASLFEELREALPDKLITLWAGKATTFWGHGPTHLNGVGAEKFMVYSGWDMVLESYQAYADQAPEPHAFYINNHHESDPDPGAASKNNFRNMRFGLATTLLHDGYYSYEDGDHPKANEHWWVRYFDEYDTPLGEPLGPYATIDEAGVYCRFFQGGAMILNGATEDKAVTEDDLRTAAVELGLDWDTIAGVDGHFYRFAGQQNPEFNDGSLFEEITLPSKPVWHIFEGRKGDGILLVRTPNQPVIAAVIIDTESFVTSPSAEDATLDGFEGTCGDHLGFRTGYHYCSEVNPLYGYAESDVGDGHTATYEVTLVQEGMYRVYEYHPEVDGYDVPHTIDHADGQETLTVDQRVESERWNLLGTYRFTPDAPAKVVITDMGAGSRIAADAIRFEWAGPA